MGQEEYLKVVADVGNTRVVGKLVKQNPLTTVMKIEVSSLMDCIRSHFMENGVSMTEYRNMLKKHGITRDGVTKRHNLKHRVNIT